MEEFIAIISLIAGVLQIFLFFKVWGMTNDVRAIVNKLDSIFDSKSNNRENKGKLVDNLEKQDVDSELKSLYERDDTIHSIIKNELIAIRLNNNTSIFNRNFKA